MSLGLVATPELVEEPDQTAGSCARCRRGTRCRRRRRRRAGRPGTVWACPPGRSSASNTVTSWRRREEVGADQAGDPGAHDRDPHRSGLLPSRPSSRHTVLRSRRQVRMTPIGIRRSLSIFGRGGPAGRPRDRTMPASRPGGPPWPATGEPSSRPDRPRRRSTTWPTSPTPRSGTPATAAAERLDDGPVGLGSAFRLGVRVGGRVTPLDYRIVAYDRPHRVVLLGESDTIRSEDTVTVAPAADGGSILTYDADLPPEGRLSRWPTRSWPVVFDRIGDQGAAGLRATARRPRRCPPTAPRPAALVAAAVDGVLEADGGRQLLVASGRRCGAARPGGRPPPSLAGRTVLVTGATSGLGLAAATRRGPAGCRGGPDGPRPRPGRAGRRPRCADAAPAADVSYLLADMGEFDQVRAPGRRVPRPPTTGSTSWSTTPGRSPRTGRVTGSGLELTVAVPGGRPLPADRAAAARPRGRRARPG